ncbi:unnamed protein product [Prunus armeniaca]|uniref:Retrotransposon gag domain-containing protein n=1 Tax=Prunus armeniaca TaxID=36596 RepID=A0A6J5X7E2_PRUAR|nr:unnamed protein product [Prunus armeniaca]
MCQVMAPTKLGKTDEPEMDFEHLFQMMENLSKQVADSDIRSRLVERRLADLEAANQHDEASVNGEERNRERQHHDIRNDRDTERHNFHRGYEQDLDERVMRSVKVDAPNFDGELNPKALLDWLATIDHYFEWHDMSEARRVRFTKIKLVGQAGLFWTNVETQLERAGEEPTIYWGEMKERVFQMVQELEKYLKSSNVVKQTDSQRSGFHVDTSVTPSSTTSTSTTNLVKNAKGKGVLVDTRGGGTQRCYRCQGFGHFAFQSPTKEATRNLHAHINEQADNQGEFEEDIYEPQQPDEDCGIDFEVPHPTLAVVRCTLAQPRKETVDWCRTSIFHTYIKSGDKNCKVVIDNGSCINVVSMLTVSSLGLSPEKHLVPYRVAWIDNTSSIPVTQPWIYDYNVTILGQENICLFIHKGKKITMKPLQPKLVNQSIPNKEEKDKVGKTKVLHIITLKECKEDAEVPSQVEVKPDSRSARITKEDLPHIDPDVFECYYSFISPESRSFQPGVIDANIIS